MGLCLVGLAVLLARTGLAREEDSEVVARALTEELTVVDDCSLVFAFILASRAAHLASSAALSRPHDASAAFAFILASRAAHLASSAA